MLSLSLSISLSPTVPNLPLLPHFCDLLRIVLPDSISSLFFLPPPDPIYLQILSGETKLRTAQYLEGRSFSMKVDSSKRHLSSYLAFHTNPISTASSPLPHSPSHSHSPSPSIPLPLFPSFFFFSLFSSSFPTSSIPVQGCGFFRGC